MEMTMPVPINWIRAGQNNNRYRVVFSDAVFSHYAGIGYFTNLGDALAFLKSGIILSILNTTKDIVAALQRDGHDDSINSEAWNGLQDEIGRMNPHEYSVKFNKGVIDEYGRWWGDFTVAREWIKRMMPEIEDRHHLTSKILIKPEASESPYYLDSEKMIDLSGDAVISIVFDYELIVGDDSCEFYLEAYNIPDSDKDSYLRQGWHPVWSGYWQVPTRDYLSGDSNSYTAILQSREPFTVPVRQDQTPDQR